MVSQVEIMRGLDVINKIDEVTKKDSGYIS
ncbi:MAG: hypothetical protein FD178_3173 [Ignavibacteria bacterium]|nr:MAG: hypothetical protein FD178_3173 [Ignavibacteria bacterium]